jgi:hypothetical protein
VDVIAAGADDGGVTKATVVRFLTLALLWGGSFTLIKVSLEGLSRSCCCRTASALPAPG